MKAGDSLIQKLTALFCKLDDTLLIDSASGWFDRRQGDLKSEHNYFAKQFVTPSDRAFVISEYGGYTPAKPSRDIPVPARHTDIKSALHRKNSRQPIINLRLKKSTSKNRDCATVYTQLSDIEDEINGQMTYDRRFVSCRWLDKVTHPWIRIHPARA